MRMDAFLVMACLLCVNHAYRESVAHEQFQSGLHQKHPCSQHGGKAAPAPLLLAEHGQPLLCKRTTAPSTLKTLALFLLVTDRSVGWLIPTSSCSFPRKQACSDLLRRGVGSTSTSSTCISCLHHRRTGVPISSEIDNEPLSPDDLLRRSVKEYDEPLSQKARLRKSLKDSAKFKIKNDARFAWFSIGAVCAGYAGFSYDGTAAVTDNFSALLGGLGTLISAALFFLPELLALQRKSSNK